MAGAEAATDPTHPHRPLKPRSITPPVPRKPPDTTTSLTATPPAARALRINSTILISENGAGNTNTVDIIL